MSHDLDSCLKNLIEVKREMNFKGSNKELLVSIELIDYCVNHKLILKNASKSDFNKKMYEEKYYPHLLRLGWEFLLSKEHLSNADELMRQPGCRKAGKVLWNHGVFGDLREQFTAYQRDKSEKFKAKHRPSLTLSQLYEICQIYHGFEGSESSFRRHIQRTYGSFAEYCLQKGYDINASKWEDPEAALRVAKKFESFEALKYGCPSLLKFLQDKDLLRMVFPDVA